MRVLRKILVISHRLFRLTDVVTLVPPDRCGCGDDPAYEVDYEVSSTLLDGLGLGPSWTLIKLVASPTLWLGMESQ